MRPTVPLPSPRARVEESAERLRLDIPTRRLSGQLFGCLAGVCIWVIGDVGVLLSAFTDLEGPTDDPAGDIFGYVFLGFWLLAWNTFGLFAFAGLLWRLLGRDVVEVTADQVLLERRAGPYVRRRAYARESVAELRVLPKEGAMGFAASWPGPKQYGIGIGRLCFDYGDSSVRFGEVSEPEGKRLIEAMRAPRHLTARSTLA